MLILIYLLSVLFFYLILRKDIQKAGYKPTLKNMYKYYKFDVIWMFVPIINTCLVFLWVIIKIKISF